MLRSACDAGWCDPPHSTWLVHDHFSRQRINHRREKSAKRMESVKLRDVARRTAKLKRNGDDEEQGEQGDKRTQDKGAKTEQRKVPPCHQRRLQDVKMCQEVGAKCKTKRRPKNVAYSRETKTL